MLYHFPIDIANYCAIILAVFGLGVAEGSAKGSTPELAPLATSPNCFTIHSYEARSRNSFSFHSYKRLVLYPF